MPPLIARLAALCGEQLLREKILVAPSLAIGHQIADAIAHSGTPWVNLRVETIRTLADGVAGFSIAAEGLTVLSRAQALALIERACDSVLGSTSYFAALADRPGLHRAIQKSIDDLRHAGLTAADLSAGEFEDGRKAADLAAILRAYDEQMRRGRSIDRFEVLARATAMASPRDAVWLLVDDVELTKAEERFLEAIAGEWQTLSAAEGGGGTPATPVFRKAVGEENEVRGAFRAILADRQTFDDAEIVYTARDPYLPLIYELAAEYDVPATFAEGIPSYFTRPGQAALAFLRWIGDGWHATELYAIARRHTRVLRKAAIGWGRDRYLKRIDALIAEEQNRDEPKEWLIDAAREARVFVSDLLRVSEAVSGGAAIDVAAAARSARDFLGVIRTVRNEVDAMADAGLKRLFDELAAIGAASGERREVAGRLADAVRELHVSASNPRPGFLHVAPVRAGGWAARGRLFVVGLDDARHPGSTLQDPIILDSERASIGIPIVGDRPQRRTDEFKRLLARTGGREVTLSWPVVSINDRRERFPSPVLLDMLPEHAIAIEKFVDPQPLSTSEWFRLRRFADGTANLRADILAAYENLRTGAEAEEARAGNTITAWDGRIDAPPDDLDPRTNGKLYSASQLERMAGCPYRHFLDRILKIHPIEDIEFDPDTWLQAMEFGSLFHEVLETAMREICERGEKPSLAFLPRMQRIADQALAEWREEIPPPSDSAFERRRDELLESCEIFLRVEEDACRDVTPAHFELEFGPYTLPLGHGKGVVLRGRIDRVDRVDGKDEWHVWDYKSGSTYQFDQGGILQCGTKIQHAIYSRAVEDLLGGRVTKSGYYFPTAKGGGARLERQCADKELKDALNLLFDTIRTGWFPHGNEETCKYCEFAEICGGAKRAAERTERKATDSWRKLQGIE